MTDNKEAYKLSIKEGKVRIVINIEEIDIKITNTAEEFINAKDDKISLFLNFEDLEIKSINENGYDLISSTGKRTSLNSLSPKKDSIWFDVAMSDMSSMLKNTIQFSAKGNFPKHINYFIKKLDYKIEWLQYDNQKDSISTVSVTKRRFSQSREESDTGYSIEEIAKCAELLNRAIKKIDLRTGSSYVRINTEDGVLDSVLVAMAENLGYQLEILDDEAISDLQQSGRKATHIISLMINY